MCAAVDTCETVQSAIRKVMDGDAGSHQHTINNTLSHSGSCAWLLLVLYLLSAFLCPLVITEMDDNGSLIPAAMTLDAPPVAPPVDPRAPLGAMTNTPSDTHESLTPRTFGIVQAATRAAVEMLQANGVAAAAASTAAAAAPPPAAPAPASQVKPPTASKRRTKNSAPQRMVSARCVGAGVQPPQHERHLLPQLAPPGLRAHAGHVHGEHCLSLPAIHKAPGVRRRRGRGGQVQQDGRIRRGLRATGAAGLQAEPLDRPAGGAHRLANSR